jgi:hypothetical protein
MKPKFLFPNGYKRYGWLLTVPMLVYGIVYLILEEEVEIPYFTFEFPNWYQADILFGSNNLTDEFIVTLLTVGLLLVGFSQEKVEDEWVAEVRLESLQWGVLLNSFLLVLFTLFVYGGDYLTVVYVNMFSALVLFVLRFNMIIYVKPYFESKAERNNV